MKIAIVGAGAIGGYLGARLSAAGEDVTFIARNRNLEAINARGFRLILEDGSELHAPGVRAVQLVDERGVAAARHHDLLVEHAQQQLAVVLLPGVDPSHGLQPELEAALVQRPVDALHARRRAGMSVAIRMPT